MLLTFFSLLLLCFYVDAHNDQQHYFKHLEHPEPHVHPGHHGLGDHEYKDAKKFFNDNFGRNVMFPLAAAAYSHEPEECLGNRLKEAKVVGKYKTDCGPLPFAESDKCFGYTAVSHYHHAIILSFRGVDQILQLILEKFQAVCEKKVSVFGGGKVGRYFHDAYNAIWVAGMYKDLKMLMEKYPRYDIWLTGHSLGGSMASIAAHELAAKGLCKGHRIVTVTFGEPRTGDAEFAAAHNKLLKYTYRVVHNSDFMPHTPIDIFNYHQYKYEVWYDNEMNQGAPYKICKKPEDENCSEGRGFSLSPIDHLNYYKHFILTYAKNGCIDKH